MPDFLPGRLVWGAVAIVIAIVLSRVLRRVAARWEYAEAEQEEQLMSLRRRETALVIVATAIPYFTALVVVILLASLVIPAAALGGTAFVAIILAFAAQRFLMDVIAGALIAFERWYGVGDFVRLEPTGTGGFVEQFSLRTTVLRSLNGDRAYTPNSQIVGAVRPARNYRPYSIEVLASDPEVARRAIESIARRAPTGHARFLRPPQVVEERELGEDTWLVRGRADVLPTMEWLAEQFLVEELKARLGDELIADPIVYTLDEGTLSRYSRRILVR
jgi:small-conductance mechanosensitive channel